MVKDPSIKHEIVKLLKENIEETFTYTGNGFLDKIQTAQHQKQNQTEELSPTQKPLHGKEISD